MTGQAANNGISSRLKDYLLALVRQHRVHFRDLRVGAHLYRTGTHNVEICWLAKGWLLTYRDIDNGSRQGLELLLPGAFVGLEALDQAPMAHSALAVTEATLYCCDVDAIHDMLSVRPDIGIEMIRQYERNRSSLHDHIVNVGRRSARERTEVFLKDLRRRMQVQRETQGNESVPLTQQLLSEILGLTPIHMNRVLQKMKSDGLIRTTRGRIFLRDTAFHHWSH